VKSTVRVLSSTWMRTAGVDVTDAFAGRSTLVVAPHPDDETLGCGAAIARMRDQGTPVEVVFVSAGGSSPRPSGMSLDELLLLRRGESIRALAVLGVDSSAVVHLDFEDGALTERRHDIADTLTELLRTSSPRQVLVTSASDRHADHAAAALAVRLAVSRCTGPVQLYEYPIWQRVPALTAARDATRGAVSRQGGRGGQVLRPRLVRSGGFLDRKTTAMASYESQLPHFPVGFLDDFQLPFESFMQILPPQR
jgi:LmbE family N-acetylglucosaminyl deacetylase